MDSARIAALLEPFLNSGETSREPQQGGSALTSAQLDHISAYIDLLLRWNARINLTAIRKPEEIVTRHFGESLFLARQLFPRADRTLLFAPPAVAKLKARSSLASSTSGPALDFPLFR